MKVFNVQKNRLKRPFQMGLHKQNTVLRTTHPPDTLPNYAYSLTLSHRDVLCGQCWCFRSIYSTSVILDITSFKWSIVELTATSVQTWKVNSLKVQKKVLRKMIIALQHGHQAIHRTPDMRPQANYLQCLKMNSETYSLTMMSTLVPHENL